MSTLLHQILKQKEELGLVHDEFFCDNESNSRSVVRSEMKRIKKTLDVLLNMSSGVVLTIPTTVWFFTNDKVNREIFYVLFYNDDLDTLDTIVNEKFFSEYSVDDLMSSGLVQSLYLCANETYDVFEFYLGPHIGYLRENNYDTVVHTGKVYGGVRIWFTTIEEYERCCK